MDDTARIRGYRDLIVWQRAMELVPSVYGLSNRLPKEEQFGLISQIRRAAVSVPANIAEGQAREGSKAFSNHLSIARGSLAELDTLLLLSVRLGYLMEPDLAAVTAQIIEVRRLLQGLLRTLLTRD